MRFLQGHWTFLVGSTVGREMVWRFSRSQRAMVLHSQHMIQRFKGRVAILVDNKILTMVEPEEVESLVSPQTQAPGKRMQGSKHFKRRYRPHNSVKKAFFQYLVIARKKYKIRPDDDDGWREITPFCREYSSSRSFPKTKVLAAIPEGTTIGPVLEVHFVKKLTDMK